MTAPGSRRQRLSSSNGRNTGNRRHTLERLEEVIPYVRDDEEVLPLVINTIEKMKLLSDAEFHKLDLEPYKQEPEDGE